MAAVETFNHIPVGVVTAGGTTTSDTAWTVTVSTAFPAASAGSVQFHVCDPAATGELILVTTSPGGTGAGQSWTVTRGADSTTAVAHTAGFTIYQVVPASWLNSVNLSAVVSVTAADTSIVVGGTATAPTVKTGTLDVIAADHPPAADWSNNSHKITSLANGSGAQDAAAFGQIPTSLPPNGSAGGALGGTYPNPSLATPLPFTGGTAATVVLEAEVTGDGNERFTIAADGTHKWGPGSAGTDLTANRSAAGVLTVTGLAVTNLASVNGGTDTSGTATASSPVFVSGTAAQLNTSQDAILYVVNTSGTSQNLQIQIGPTSGVADTIVPSLSAPASAGYTIRIPKSWWVKITATIANFTITAVTC